MIEKLLDTYNFMLSKRFKCDFNLLDDIKCSISIIESLQSECISDCDSSFKELEYIKKYLYFKYIEKDLKIML